MPAENWQKLSYQNAHPRDMHIAFDAPTHKYYVNGTCEGNISCTGFVHEFFGHFDAKAIIDKMRKGPKWATSKYFGKTDAEIMAEWSNNGKVASEAAKMFSRPESGYQFIGFFDDQMKREDYFPVLGRPNHMGHLPASGGQRRGASV